MIRYHVLTKGTDLYTKWLRPIRPLMEQAFKRPVTYPLDTPDWWVISEHEGLLVGTCALSYDKRDKTSVFMYNLCVADHYRRQGIGSQLIRKTCDHLCNLKPYPCNRVWWIVHYNDVKAHIFYMQNKATFLKLDHENHSMFEIQLGC